MSVLLPAPLGPSRPVTPGPMVMVMPLTATTLPYHRETESIWMVLILGSPRSREPEERSGGAERLRGASSSSGQPAVADDQRAEAREREGDHHHEVRRRHRATGRRREELLVGQGRRRAPVQRVRREQSRHLADTRLVLLVGDSLD